MALAPNKTKLVYTIGPASESPEFLRQMLQAGMNIARLSFSLQLEVVRIAGNDVECRLLVGGELRSRKGLNLPGIDLGVSAFTERDHDCLKFALECGVDAVSQFFLHTSRCRLSRKESRS